MGFCEYAMIGKKPAGWVLLVYSNWFLIALHETIFIRASFENFNIYAYFATYEFHSILSSSLKKGFKEKIKMCNSFTTGPITKNISI